MANYDSLLVLRYIVVDWLELCKYSKVWCLRMDTLHLEVQFPSIDLTAASSSKCRCSYGWIATRCKKDVCSGMHTSDLHSCEFHLGERVLVPKLYSNFKCLSSWQFFHFPTLWGLCHTKSRSLSWPGRRSRESNWGGGTSLSPLKQEVQELVEQLWDVFSRTHRQAIHHHTPWSTRQAEVLLCARGTPGTKGMKQLGIIEESGSLWSSLILVVNECKRTFQFEMSIWVNSVTPKCKNTYTRVVDRWGWFWL